MKLKTESSEKNLIKGNVNGRIIILLEKIIRTQTIRIKYLRRITLKAFIFFFILK